MSTIRKDPVTGRKVIIASDRADRPRKFRSDGPELSSSGKCPFCPGHEDATPAQISALPEQGEWRVRVVPNKFPAVSSDEELTEHDTGLFQSTSGVGAHEVIIESRDHVVSLTELDVDQIDRVLESWQQRIRDLGRDQRLDAAMVFKNHGAPAGASIEHAHSQLVALPFVPPRLDQELEGSRAYYDRNDACVYCDLLDDAVQSGERLVESNGATAVIAPYASRFPFELTVLPTEHRARFEETPRETRRAFARALLKTLDRLDRALDAPPYNAVLHTAPLRSDRLDYFHWHLELIPTLSHIAGFEWGSGSHINPTPPERAARHLRRMDPEDSES